MKPAWFIVGIAIVFYCYEFFLRIFPSTVMGPLMLHFGIGPFAMAQLLASYYLTYSLFQIPAGVLLDHYPASKVLSFAILICVVGLLLFIDCSNAVLAEFARMLIGVGSAFSFIGVLKISRVYLPGQYFGRMAGLAISFGTLSACYAEVIALKLVALTNWISIFHVSILIGLILAGVLWAVLEWAQPSPFISKRPSWKKVWLETKKLLKHRTIWLNAIMGGLFYAPTSILADLYGTRFLSIQYLLSLPESAFCISLLFLGWVLGSPIMGLLSDRFYHELGIMRLTAVLSLIISILIIYFHFLNAFYIESLMFIFGLFSSGQILVWKSFNKIAPSEVEGVGAAMTNMLIMLTVAACQLLVGYFMHIAGLYQFHVGLAVIPLCLIFSILISYKLYESKPMAGLAR